MKLSPHTHVESPLTGSTIPAFVARAKELGRTHMAYTDNGSLSSALKTYNAIKKAGIKPILGIEIYFKDVNDPILMNSVANRCKYFTTTIYCQDQAAYQELSRIVSRTDMLTTTVQEEVQQLWTWVELEQISKFNTNIVLSGIHCMVSKPMLAGDPKLGDHNLKKLTELFKGRVFAALTIEPWAKLWNNVIEIKYVDGTKDTLLDADVVTTDKAKNIKAIDIVDRPGHTLIKSKSVASMNTEINKKISSTKLHRGFLPIPGGDVTLRVNKFLSALAQRYGLTVLATDYAYYAHKEDKVVQTMRTGGANRLHSNLYMKTSEEAISYLVSIMGLSESYSNEICTNNDKWASLFDGLKLDYEWRLPDSEGEPIMQAMDIIRKNGRMKWDNPIYVARLKEELEVISKNGVKDLIGYFLPICDVMTMYRENGELTGPARGSAAGSLLCYLLGITQVDSIKADLSFPRFLSLDRIKNGDFPDVDSDFGSRDLLVGPDGQSGYLYGRWGNKAAQISTRHTIRLKSAVKDVNRFYRGTVEQEIEAFSKALPDPPQGVPDSDFVFGYTDKDSGVWHEGLMEIDQSLKSYIEKRPAEWNIVRKALGITRAFSQHASAFVISDIPISDIMPTKMGHITQYDAKAVEMAKLLKYDFLVVKNIKDIEVCLNLINKKNNEKHTIGNFTHNGKPEYIWALPEDPDVFKSVWDGNTSTIFQIDTKSMLPFVKDIMPCSVDDLSVILALVRPGPMDFIDPVSGRSMAQEYVARRNGTSQPDLKELYDLIPETHGVIVYQEQSLKISKELGGMAPAAAEKLRRLFSKKLKKEAGEMKTTFMSTAIPNIGEEKANKIWDMMETSSRYSFNKSHSFSYAMIAYAGMFLRHHYPLEWWAAILTNAEEKEITGKLWPFVKDKLFPPDINLSTDEMVVDYANQKIRSKLGIIKGLGDKTIDPIVQNRPYANLQDFVNKGVAGDSLAHKLIHVGVLDSLFPPSAGLLEKLKMYEDAAEIKAFNDKKEKAATDGKKFKASQPASGTIPEKYMNLKPFQDAAMRKAVLPSLYVDMYAIASQHSRHRTSSNYSGLVRVKNSRNQDSILVNGQALQRLAELDPDSVNKDRYFASTCYVIETKEFLYSKNTKRALKMILDADGYVFESVIWPQYETGELVYPANLTKNSIATVFFRKKVGRQELGVMDIAMETE